MTQQAAAMLCTLTTWTRSIAGWRSWSHRTTFHVHAVFGLQVCAQCAVRMAEPDLASQSKAGEQASQASGDKAPICVKIQRTLAAGSCCCCSCHAHLSLACIIMQSFIWVHEILHSKLNMGLTCSYCPSELADLTSGEATMQEAV